LEKEKKSQINNYKKKKKKRVEKQNEGAEWPSLIKKEEE
jgi:hypothetical protein